MKVSHCKVKKILAFVPVWLTSEKSIFTAFEEVENAFVFYARQQDRCQESERAVDVLLDAVVLAVTLIMSLMPNVYCVRSRLTSPSVMQKEHRT